MFIVDCLMGWWVFLVFGIGGLVLGGGEWWINSCNVGWIGLVGSFVYINGGYWGWLV